MDKVKKYGTNNWFYSYNLIFEMNLSIYAKIVYLYYCRCADKEGSCFPKHETTAAASSIGVTKVKDANRELLEAKLLSKKPRFILTENEKMKQISNEYTIYPEPYEGDVPPNDGEGDLPPVGNAAEKSKEAEVCSLIDNSVDNGIIKTENSTHDYEDTPNSANKGSRNTPPSSITGSRNTPSRQSQYDPTPSRNTSPSGSHYDYQEVLPTLSTTYKEVQSVCLSKHEVKRTTDKTDDDTSDELRELELIKEKCELQIIESNTDKATRKMLECAIELMFFAEDIKVDNSKIPRCMIRSRMYDLHGAILLYALEKIKKYTATNTESICNSTKYLISCIYHAINEYHLDAELAPY